MLRVDHARRGRDGAENEAMQSQNRFFDDLARVAAGAIGTLSGVKSEVESRLREQLERVLAGMDLVTRDEFEAVKAMAAKARAEQEDLAKRVAELEGFVAALRDRRDADRAPPSAIPLAEPILIVQLELFCRARAKERPMTSVALPNRRRFSAIRSISSKRSSAPTNGRTTGPAKRNWWSRFRAAGATTGCISCGRRNSARCISPAAST